MQANQHAVQVNVEATPSEDDSTECASTAESDTSSGELWGATNRNEQTTAKERGTLTVRELEIQLPVVNIFSTQKAAPWKRRQISVDKSLLAASRQHAPSATLLQLFLRRKATRYRIYRTIYTDGSRRSGKSGFGVVSDELLVRKRIDDMASIYAAESEAAKEALSWVVEQEGGGAYLICTDSLSVITALENKKLNNVWKNSMMSLYDRCIRNGADVTFLWVPSHVGIPGNEHADREAKAALEQPIDRSIGLDMAEIKTCIKKHIIWRWQTQWHAVRGNKLREVKNTVIPYTNDGKSRRESVILARLRIGHTALTHQHLLERSEEPICQGCNDRLSVKHIIEECPALEYERREIGLRPNLREALADHQERMETVIKFLKHIRLFDRL